jgi:outer membrane immunogenic protein
MFKMKSITNKLLATAAVSALLTCSPIASDAQAQEELWHGLYLGSNLGWAWGESDLAFSAPGSIAPTFNSSLDTDGFAYGLQAGLNHQMGMLVVGVEADLMWMDEKDTVQFLPGLGITQDFRQNVDYVGTIRGRIGAAVANAMLYFTGGWAFGQVDNEIEFQGPGLSPLRVEDGDSGSGYTLGGGGEIHLGTVMGLPMSAKIEYLFIDLDDTTVTTPGTLAFVPTTTTFDNEIQTVRLGINVQLGGMDH